MEPSASILPACGVGPFAARRGSDVLAPRLTLERLGAALGASVLLHAGLLGSLEQLIGGGASFHSGSRPAAGLRVTLASLAIPEPLPEAKREAVASAPPGPGVTPATAPGAKYFTAAELDRRPAPVSEIEPEYPADGPRAGGYLVARILINERGRTDKVQVLVSDPKGAFDRAVIEAFSAGRFRPGVKNGAPVKSQMTIEVRFHPEDQPGATLQEPPPPQPAPAPAKPR